MSSSSENMGYSTLIGTSESEASFEESASGSILLNSNYRPQPNKEHQFRQIKPILLESPSPSLKLYEQRTFERTMPNVLQSKNAKQTTRYNSSTHSFKTLFFPNKKSDGPKCTNVPQPGCQARTQTNNCQNKCSTQNQIRDKGAFGPPVIEVFRNTKSRNESPNADNPIDENRNLRSDAYMSKSIGNNRNFPTQKLTQEKTRTKELDNQRPIKSVKSKRTGRRKLLGSAISREEFHFVNRIKYAPNPIDQSGTTMTEEEEFKLKHCKLACQRKPSPQGASPSRNLAKSKPFLGDEIDSVRSVATTLRSVGTNPGKGSLKPKTGKLNFRARSRTLSRESKHLIREVEPSTDLFFRYSKSRHGATESLAKCAQYSAEGKYKPYNRTMRSRYMEDLEWRIGHAVNIYVYRNGVENQSPTLIHIPPNRRRNMGALIEVLQERIKYPVGYANTLYTLDGAKVKHPSQLEMYNNYVVASNFDKHFKCVQYGRKRSPLLIFSKESKNARALKMKLDSIPVKRNDVYDDEDFKYLYNYEKIQPNFVIPRDHLNYYDKFNIRAPQMSYTIRDFDGIEQSATTIYAAAAKKNLPIRSRLQEEFPSNFNYKDNNNLLPSTLSPNDLPYSYKMDIYKNYMQDNIIPPPTGFRD